MSQISHHMLMDTGSPKDICPEPWLEQAHRKPIKTIELPPDIRPFRFAKTPVHPRYIACLAATLTDIAGNTHTLRQVAYILPDMPIPFLLRLQTQRSLSFDICLREGNASHLNVNSWNQLIPLVVNSHLWLNFTPCNTDPDPTFDWTPLIKKAFILSQKDVNICLPIGIGDIEGSDPPLVTARATMVRQTSEQPSTIPENTVDHAFQVDISDAYPIPAWHRDDWKSKMTLKNVGRLHLKLRHPHKEALLKLYRQLQEERKLPKVLRQRIENLKCQLCNEHVQLPRRPKLALPLPATPNLAVSLDGMEHRANNMNIDILVMLDSGDMMLRLYKLNDRTGRTAFNAFLYRSISIFDAPIFTIVDRGSNLVNDYMSTNLRSLESQLCPIPTEAPFSIGDDESSHSFIHKALDKMLSTPGFDCGDNHEKLLAEIEMAWNFTQHVNRIVPNFHRFGIIPRVLSENADTTTTQARIALMEMARVETERLRAEQLLHQALHPLFRHATKFMLFTIGQKVWFHRKDHGWRIGCVARIDRRTRYVSFHGYIYPTHECRVRSYFVEFSLPPEVMAYDKEQAIPSDRTLENSQSTTNQHPSSNTATPSRRTDMPISELVNGIFSVSSMPEKHAETICLEDGYFHAELVRTEEGIIDSTLVFLTTAETIMNVSKLPTNDQRAFARAKLEEIRFILDVTVSPVARSTVEPDYEIQQLKWILNIKRSPSPNPPVRHRARLLSASNLSKFRHSVNGNAPTIAINTVRTLFALFPTWRVQTECDGDELVTLVRDVTKAYLQNSPSLRLVYYEPPPEFYDAFPDKRDFVWKAHVQLYGDVEAGKYWNKTIIPWYCENFLDYRQFTYDPSLLYSSKHHAATVLCIDDAANVLPKSQLKVEEAITKRFKCRDAQQTPPDFKRLDIIDEKPNLCSLKAIT